MYRADNSYLEDEVRCGFYIPSIAKRAWAAELEVLSELDRICEKYGIRYFADWGTLLGAVRHRGFVPWDDDLDVCMLRADAEKFQQAAARELPEEYRLFTFENNDYNWKFVLNLVNSERMNFTPEYLKSHYNFPYMATIDIFVLDNMTDDEVYEERRAEAVKYILKVFDSLKEDNFKSEGVRTLLSHIKKTYGISIGFSDDFNELRRRMYRAVLSLLVQRDDENTGYVSQLISMGIYHKQKFPRSYFDETVRLPFEGTEISVPGQYDGILRSKYGNYETPVMGAGGHGYPYYRAQKEALGLAPGEDYIPHYKFGGIPAAPEIAPAEDGRETVLFLPFKGCYWDGMKKFYEAECAHENADVFVVPLPYFYKEYDGRMSGEMQYDLMAYPEDLSGYAYEEIDVSTLAADRIYIQNPYDEYNMCMSVPAEFYASNLRRHCGKLIYVPWFKTADFGPENYPQNYNMQYYCTVPGVVLSDEVYVSSEVIRERYIEKLTDFAGDETRKIWQERIKVNPFE